MWATLLLTMKFSLRMPKYKYLPLNWEDTEPFERLILSCRLQYVLRVQIAFMFFVILRSIKQWLCLQTGCSHIKLIAELIWDETEPSIAHNHIGNTFWKKPPWDDYPLFSVWWWCCKSYRGHCTELSVLDFTWRLFELLAILSCYLSKIVKKWLHSVLAEQLLW